MEKVIINGKEYQIEYRHINIGDTVYNKNSGIVYTADIMDADDLGWVVLSYNVNS